MAWTERSRSRYRVRYRHDGRILTDSTHDDEQAALARLRQLEGGRTRMKALLNPAPAPTVADWAPRWLSEHTAGPAAKAKYASLLSNHILPHLGNLRLDAIDKTTVKGFAGKLRKRLAHGSVKSTVTLLGTMVRDAVDDRVLTYDPTARIRLIAPPTEPRPVLSPQQVWQLACRMPTMSMLAMVVTAAYTGMRFGELAGLAPDAVDLDGANLHIHAKHGSLHEVSGLRWLGPPKTAKAVRDIHLPPFLVDGLRTILHGHDAAQVFCADDGGWLWRTNFANRIWRPACDGDPRQGWDPIVPELRFQDLRHTHRTWMDEDGICEIVKSHRMGHELPDIRRVYTKVTAPMLVPLIEALQHRWNSSGATW